MFSSMFRLFDVVNKVLPYSTSMLGFVSLSYGRMEVAIVSYGYF